MKDQKNFDLTRYNTFGIKARCSRFVDYISEEDLRHSLDRLNDEDADLGRDNVLSIGQGSNMLFTRDFDGIVFHSSIRGIIAMPTDDGIRLRAGSGESWDGVVAYCVANKWYGAENLSLIPGTVGASAVQNIGAYGAEVSDLIESIDAIDIDTGKGVEFLPEECGYGYRTSYFKTKWKNRYLITSVTFRLSNDFTPDLDYGTIENELDNEGIDYPTAEELRNVIIKIRRSKLPDPDDLGNAGSFFKNPVIPEEQYDRLKTEYPAMPGYPAGEKDIKTSAAWLIEQCGWKGRRLGRAGVYERQPLVLVNEGGAEGKEILDLCAAIQDDVYNKFQIQLDPEVYII